MGIVVHRSMGVLEKKICYKQLTDKTGPFYFNKTKISPIKAGMACTKRIFLLAVTAPYIPAIVTQLKKKRDVFICHVGSEMHKDQISPAAKKPLYKP